MFVESQRGHLRDSSGGCGLAAPVAGEGFFCSWSKCGGFDGHPMASLVLLKFPKTSFKTKKTHQDYKIETKKSLQASKLNKQDHTSY